MESRSLIRPVSDDFYVISKMLMHFAETMWIEENTNENGLVVSTRSNPDDPRCVQKDGPGGKKRNRTEKPALPPVMSLRTVDGEMYLFDHGKLIETGCFQYHHIISCENVIALKLDEDASLVPIRGDDDNPDGTKLIKREDYKQETPTSETVNLLGVKYDKTLALEYSDDPKSPHAKLVLLPQHELKQIMEDMEKGKKMNIKINPLIKIRTHVRNANSEASTNCNNNNIALYFVTSWFYYYIHVTKDPSDPKLSLERVERTTSFDPHVDYVRHLQFTEKIVKKGEDTHNGTLASVEGEKEKLEKHLLPDLNGLELNGSSPSDPASNKPTFLQIVSEVGTPDELNTKELKKETLTNESTPDQDNLENTVDSEHLSM